MVNLIVCSIPLPSPQERSVLRLPKPLSRHVQLAANSLSLLELCAGPLLLCGQLVPRNGGRDAVGDGLVGYGVPVTVTDASDRSELVEAIELGELVAGKH